MTSDCRKLCDAEGVNGQKWAEKRIAPKSCPLIRKQKNRCFQRILEAAGQGFEPQLPGPEPGVLPLDDPATAGAVYRVGYEGFASPISSR
jgi:hypothetical protein